MKTILITGGTGFLGKNLALKLKSNYRVVLTGRNNKQNFTAGKITGCEVIPMDVVRIESIRDAFIAVKPDIVIHAAATKFVDLSEREPMECIDVNVTGSQNVIRVSLERNVETLIGISTDKAAPPIKNIYGMSKSIMERMFCAMDAKSGTKIACVRYGNVPWSTGSVLCLWKEMFDRNQIIETTGPEMIRFFFRIEDAVALIQTAIDHIGEIHGRILIREMKSAKMRDVLDVWIKNHGGQYTVIAERPGDRKYEYLFGESGLEYITTKKIGNVTRYILSFTERSHEPAAAVISSENAEKLTDREIQQILESNDHTD